MSYAAEDRTAADEIALALQGQGHEVFFDKVNLSGSEDFHSTIRARIARADFFLFLISPDSIKPGSYALTELRIAREKWPHPAEHVVPLLLKDTDQDHVPVYLRSVTIFEPEGNVAGEIADFFASRHRRRNARTITGIALSILILAGLIVYHYFYSAHPARSTEQVDRGGVQSSTVPTTLDGSAAIPHKQQPESSAVQPPPVRKQLPGASPIQLPRVHKQELESNAVQLSSFRISIMSAERCIVEWRPKEPNMSEATLAAHGVDIFKMKSSIAKITATILKRNPADVNVLPGEKSDVMPGAAYGLSSLGVNDSRYDTFHVYVTEKEITVSLFKSGQYAERIEPGVVGIDWPAFQDALGATLKNLYREKYEVEFGDVRTRTFASGEWDFVVPYMLREHPKGL